MIKGDAISLLKVIEWSGGHDRGGYCMWCGEFESHGHADDCRLAALLGEHDVPAFDYVAFSGWLQANHRDVFDKWRGMYAGTVSLEDYVWKKHPHVWVKRPYGGGDKEE